MNTVVDHTTDTHIHNPRLLRIFRVVWFAVVAFTAVVFLITLPAKYALLVNTPRYGIGYQAALDQLGLSREIFAVYLLSGEGLLLAICLGLALLIFQRRSEDWMALMASATVVVFAVAISPLTAQIEPIFSVLIGGIGLPLIYALMILFPDGHFVPRWTRWTLFFAVPLYALMMVLQIPLLRGEGFPPVLLPALIAGLALGALGLFAQGYRHRYVASAAQRQQSKWVIFGFIVAGSAAVLYFAVQVTFPELIFPTYFPQNTTYGVPSLLWMLVSVPLVLVMTSLIPLGIFLSMVRFRLWSVDLMLNRSITTGLASALVALIFLIGLVMRQALFNLAFGTNSYAAGIGIGATIAIAVVLFNPIRKIVQRFVDRRIFGLNFDLNQLAQAQKPTEVTHRGVLTGKTLGGFKLLDVLGKGGMGEVYRGVDAGGRQVALKILPDELAQQPEYLSRFTREAEVMRQMDHPNVLHLVGMGESENVHYLALDYIDGPDLKAYLQQRGKLTMDEAAPLLRDLGAALDYAHVHGVVHRDLKPSNVLLRKDGKPNTKPPRHDGVSYQAVLMDFGIAKLRDARTRYTGSGAIGTIDYMAPEQIMAAKEVDHRADVYALGLMAYEMLTGETPFKGGAAQIMFAHLQQPAPDVRECQPAVPQTMAQAIQRAMAKAPEDRFESAGAFAAAIGGAT